MITGTFHFDIGHIYMEFALYYPGRIQEMCLFAMRAGKAYQIEINERMNEEEEKEQTETQESDIDFVTMQLEFK